MADDDAPGTVARLSRALDEAQARCARLAADVTALRAALREYGRHAPDCRRGSPGGLSGYIVIPRVLCSCGLDAVRIPGTRSAANDDRSPLETEPA